MSYPNCIALAALFASAIAGWPTDSRAQKAEAEKDSVPFGHIAVIEPESVLKHHRWYRERLGQLRSDEEAAKAKLAKQREELQDLQQQLIALGEGTDFFAALAAEIAQKQQEIEAAERQLVEEAKTNRLKLHQAIWAEICRHSEDFAKKYNIVLVLGWREPNEMDQNLSLEDAKALFTTDVLYHNNIDISSIVERSMNPPQVFRPPPPLVPR